MKALRKSLVIVLAAAIPAALVAQAIGSPLFSETVEATLSAFASAGLIVIALTDYAYRRPRDIFVSNTSAVRRETPRPTRRPALRASRQPVASLTGSC